MTNQKPYIIAEIGSNFDQSLIKAKNMILAAKRSGADAVKFQLFNPKKLYPSDKDKKIRDLFKKIKLRKNYIPKLISFAKKNKIEIFFSVFDIENLNFLKKFNLSTFKIASSEVINLKLIHQITKTGKTVILSTGMSDIKDVENAVRIIKKSKGKKIIMQCASIYPAKVSDSNLNVLKSFKKKYPNFNLGFSDHTINNISAIVAVGLGCKYFEKHFTLNKKSKGPDHFFAYNENQFKKYVMAITQAYKCLGSSKKQMLPLERKFGRRKGIYAKKNIRKGEVINSKNIFGKFPSLGLRYRDKDLYINKFKSKKFIHKFKPIYRQDLI